MPLLIALLGCRGVEEQTTLHLTLHTTLEAEAHTERERVESQLYSITRRFNENPDEDSRKTFQGVITQLEALKEESDSIYRQIKSIQHQLIKVAGGMTGEGLAENRTVKARIHAVLYREKKAGQLTKSMTDFIYHVNQFRKNGLFSFKDNGNATQITIPPARYYAYLQEADLATALSTLSAIEVDRLQYLNGILAEYHLRVSRLVRKLKWDAKKDRQTIVPMVPFPLGLVEKDKFLAGEHYAARVVLAAQLIGPTLLKGASFNGQKIPIESGVAHIRFRAAGLGKKTFTAGIVVRDYTGFDSTHTVEQAYTVVAKGSLPSN